MLSVPGEAAPTLKSPLASGNRRNAESGPSLVKVTSSRIELPALSLAISWMVSPPLANLKLACSPSLALPSSSAHTVSYTHLTLPTNREV